MRKGAVSGFHNIRMLILLFVNWAMLVSAVIHLDECGKDLGMESGKIKDEDINASSSYILASVGPQNARLNKEGNGGAWCPKPLISEDVTEYLEISLNELHIISKVATQGRFGNGQGLEFAEDYKLEYWRPNLSRWLRYKNALSQELMKGNTNTYTVVERKLNPVIVASKIRFIPYSVHVRTVCMRVELYGCPWRDGLVSYSMPEGEKRGTEVDFSDRTYDGFRDTYLHGGLGQLTDGITGDDNFRQDVSGFGRGYEWVGWKTDSTHSRLIDITFEFDQVRNFSAAYIYCNNMYTREVQVFASAKIWFSVGGEHFQESPVTFSYIPDTFIEKARNVTVNLRNRIGRFVKVELHFASRWILISEVSFNSVPSIGNVTEEDPPAAPPVVSTAMNEDSLTNEYVGLVIGVLAAVILLLVVVIFIIVSRNRRRKTTTHTILKQPVDNRVTINMKDLSYSQCPNGIMYNHSVILDDPDNLMYQEPKDFKVTYLERYSNESTTSREYAVPDVTISATPNNLSLTTNSFPKTTLPKHYAATDVAKLQNLQGVSGNTVYAVPNIDLLNREEVKEIPHHRLHYLENLDEGQFSELWQLDLHGNSDNIGNEVSEQGSGDQKLFCGNRTLHQDSRCRHAPRPVLGRLLQNRRKGHQAPH